MEDNMIDPSWFRWRIVFGPNPVPDAGWSTAQWLGVITCCLVAYIFMSAVTQAVREDDFDREGPIGLAWPLLLPWSAGMALVSYIRTTIKSSRLKRSNLPGAKVVKT